MNPQLERIKTKLQQLKRLDTSFSVFGSSKHKYKLNPRLSPDNIRHFEETHRISLPTEYVQFLTEIGNGGAGPFYGLEPLENVLFDDLDFKRPSSLLNPSKPFLHTEPWNLEFKPTVDEEDDEEEYERQKIAFEEVYYDDKQRNGVIAICNFGCAISLNLVVNGLEYGVVWTDDRASDAGIYPSRELGNEERITFLDWYELWLDNSVTSVKVKLSSANEKLENAEMKSKNPWWKIW